MWMKWFPWRYIVKRLTRAHGFVDPITLLSHVRRFAQPAEVAESTELLRAGVVFHARGLLNTQAIQHNLDWIWPYWVTRQFNPSDPSFIPRAFSITHVNLSHRNWTAVGVPNCATLPVVDERGLLTPFWDSWSVDVWVVSNSSMLVPSRIEPAVRSGSARQQLDFMAAESAEPGLLVRTELEETGVSLTLESRVEHSQDGLRIRLSALASSVETGRLIVSLRPYNPEGVSFINRVESLGVGQGWKVNRAEIVHFSEPAAAEYVSTYREGDVAAKVLVGPAAALSRSPLKERSQPVGGSLATLEQLPIGDSMECDIGMLSAASEFPLEAGIPRRLEIMIPIAHPVPTLESVQESTSGGVVSWKHALSDASTLTVPDPEIRYLFDAAIATLVLHSPGEIFPGPYTYKRFWFRDAAYIITALLAANLPGRVPPVFPFFINRQTRSGHFCSQDGEWDSNGQVLWIVSRYAEATGEKVPTELLRAMIRGGSWIAQKRIERGAAHAHAGLLPAGFSAEHLGPSDYYYWDDFWSIGGLEKASELLDRVGHSTEAEQFRRTANELRQSTEQSIELARKRLNAPAVPAAPYRRMDAGAIGNIVADFPLQLWEPGDPRMSATVQYLIDDCFYRGAFFQNMIHSGINAYLTLHVAQVLLRAGDQRFWPMVQQVAKLASSTGQWPEAIHPQTGGGCMGDGQHAWAAAEWVVMIARMFVREEGRGLILGSGIPPEWLNAGEVLEFGPTLTQFGRIGIRVAITETGATTSWQADWRRVPESIEVRISGTQSVSIVGGGIAARGALDSARVS